MDFYDALWYFILYSIIGWLIEVIFHAVFMGKIVNRGFLNGPVCPVYGFGMLAVFLVYYLGGTDNSFIIFLEGLVLTTTIELIAGFILDKLFHARWWDYSDRPFNLNGYICPAFSIIWGLSVLFVIKVANPALYLLTIDKIPEKIGYPILIGIYVLFIADTAATVKTIIGLNKKLDELDKIAGRLQNLSDKVTDGIGKTTQKAQETAVQTALGKAELRDNLENRYREIQNSVINSKNAFGSKRILKAFPNAKHRDHAQILKELRAGLDRKS